MKIEIDDDVFAFLEKNAKPFVETTPNSTLRRLLGMGETTISAKSKVIAQTTEDKRTRAEQADLEKLVRAGLVRNGEKLYLIDYRGNRFQKLYAVISGSGLIYNGHHYSMSNLARELLTKVGFKSPSARGPAHWVNDEGKSIKDLWQQYLNKNARN
jgi:hypothetical protein